MTDGPVSLTAAPSGYADWLAELKARIHSAQQRATLAVNREFVQAVLAQLRRCPLLSVLHKFFVVKTLAANQQTVDKRMAIELPAI